MFPGQVSVQGDACVTVTLKEQVASVFDPLVPEQLTVVVPNGKVEPDGGLHVIVILGQPLGVGEEYVTVAEPEPEGFSTAKTSFEQIKTHDRLLTVTVKLQLSVVFELLIASQSTVVAPTGKLEPDGGLHAAVDAEQLSGKVGAA